MSKHRGMGGKIPFDKTSHGVDKHHSVFRAHNDVRSDKKLKNKKFVF